ncbi:hypothetical protein CDL15_Pgr025562 [Punica granatum]|uniref:Uncharacterized protein n=1 Tax=Punica granatum TaxID=22663 RepID=A0A218WB06_PUNGR|nr:hypothetical protein CDL15_Pgr025562 [Punica granatum]
MAEVNEWIRARILVGWRLRLGWQELSLSESLAEPSVNEAAAEKADDLQRKSQKMQRRSLLFFDHRFAEEITDVAEKDMEEMR